MKKFIVSLFLVGAVICNVGGSAHASERSAGDFLTPEQKTELLSTLNRWCADAWCGGDYQYNFETIRCASGQGCKLTFTMYTYIGRDGYDGSVTPLVSHDAACSFNNVASYSEIFSEGFLADAFNDDLNTCLQQLETHFGSQDN